MATFKTSVLLLKTPVVFLIKYWTLWHGSQCFDEIWKRTLENSEQVMRPW